MHLILYQPQIPQNTGNIVRTCAVTGSRLSLVTPLGFSTSDRMLKRAGLDYWEGVTVSFIDDLETYLNNCDSFYFFSSKATQSYTAIDFQENDTLIFGSETAGLPPHFLEKWPDRYYTIPQLPNTRCLNLSTAAAVVLFEALRQTQN